MHDPNCAGLPARNHGHRTPAQARYNHPLLKKEAPCQDSRLFRQHPPRFWNRKLIQVAVDAARAAGGDVTLIDLADYPLPLYNGDLEDRDGLPDNAQRLKALFKAHDALLIASPEYNSSIPPLLKNTLDWVSRQWQANPGWCRIRTRSPPPSPPRPARWAACACCRTCGRC